MPAIVILNTTVWRISWLQARAMLCIMSLESFKFWTHTPICSMGIPSYMSHSPSNTTRTKPNSSLLPDLRPAFSPQHWNQPWAQKKLQRHSVFLTTWPIYTVIAKSRWSFIFWMVPILPLLSNLVMLILLFSSVSSLVSNKRMVLQQLDSGLIYSHPSSHCLAPGMHLLEIMPDIFQKPN